MIPVSFIFKMAVIQRVDDGQKPDIVRVSFINIHFMTDDCTCAQLKFTIQSNGTPSRYKEK